MKRFWPLIFVSLITVSLIFALNTKFGTIPPLGKLLDPFNGFWQNASLESLGEDKTLKMNGILEEVKVVYDSLMIPHIFAKNDQDLYFAQGYITAVHRLWQMEFQTHFAAGRLSEVFGGSPQVVRLDRYQRRLGLTFAARNSLSFIEKDSLAHNVMQAYTNGINAYIKSLKKSDYPIEYKIFDYKPEPWTNLKTCLLLKYMANNLAGYDYDFQSTNSLNLVGPANYKQLFPLREHQVDPVIPAGTPWNFIPVKVPENDTANRFINNSIITSNKIVQPNPENGSNNWALSGDKTANGNPILAGDPHLDLNLPSIWFVIQLNAPGINCMGASLPGAMGIIMGFNDNIAWSMTNSRFDVRDWYKIQFSDENRNQYQYGSTEKETRKTIEIIKIRGEKDFIDTVIYTDYGPVVFDSSFPSNNARDGFALRWIAHDASNEVRSFYRLNRSKNYEEFREGLFSFYCPAQNFAFASSDGDIAMVSQGKIPLKQDGQGQFVMDGADPENEWLGFIPPAQNPAALNPVRGFVSSANQFPVDSTYPYYVYDYNFEHYRNRRINERLEEMNNATIQDMQRLQNDNYNLKAAESLPALLENLDSEILTETQHAYFDMIRSWNYMNDPLETGPIIFAVWWQEFMQSYWDEFASDSIHYKRPTHAQTIYMLNNLPDTHWVDDKSTEEVENLSNLSTRSFIDAIEMIETWKSENDKAFTWSNYKDASINHLIPQLSVFSRKHIETGGGGSIINAMQGSHGPSWKMIVELGSDIKAWGVYPGGQSGNPGSPYYDNFIETWRSGKHYKLDFMHEGKAIASTGAGQLILTPRKP